MDTLVECGFKPIFQQPGDIVLSRAGCSPVHITLSAGASFGMAVNCLFMTKGSLAEHMKSTKEWLQHQGVSFATKESNHPAVNTLLEDHFLRDHGEDDSTSSS